MAPSDSSADGSEACRQEGRARALVAALRRLRPPNLPPSLRFAAAPVIIVLVFAVQRALLADSGVAPFVLLTAGVAIAAWLGGRAPGLVATLFAAALGNYYFIAPADRFNLEGVALIASALFVISGTTVAIVCGSLRAAMAQADEREAQLRVLLQEQRSAQAALRSAKYRMDRAQEIAHLGSWELDLVANRLTWSDEVYRIFGLEPQEFGATYQAFLEAVHPEDRAAVDAAYSGSQGEGRDFYEVDHRVVRRRTGEVRIVHERCDHIRDESGRIISSIGIVHDITERKRAEEVLTERKDRLDLAMGAAGIGAWDWDIVQDRRRFDDQTCQLLGIDPASFSGSGEEFFRVVHPDDWERLKEAMRRCVEHDVPYAPEYRAVWPDGTVRHVVAQGRLLRDEAGRPKRIIGVLHDITQRKEMEDALREADRRKSEFLGVLSHELRNPLAPIRNSLYILRRAAPGSAQALHAQEVINRQTSHLTRLVDDLLDVTRITRGKIHLQRSRLDLVELVRKTAEDYRSVVGAREFGIDLPAEPIWMHGDSTRLAQALGNLLSNAAKFTSEDGRISVSLRQADGRAVLRVTDNGTGIDAQTRARLFEPFAQGDRSLDRSRGGLGLGLALVKGMVELHGGEVSAQSDGCAKGACFTVVFRLDAPGTSAAVAAPPAALNTP